MCRCILLLLPLAWFGLIARAESGDLTNEKGFSLTYPDAWRSATKKELDKTAEVLRKGSKSATPPAAVIYGPLRNENVTITVTPGTSVLNGENEDDFVKAYASHLAAPGKTPPAVKKGHLTIDGKTALTLALERTSSSTGAQLRQWTVYLPGKKQKYIVVCTSLKTQWAEAFPAFDSIVKSMKIDLEDRPASSAKTEEDLKTKSE